MSSLSLLHIIILIGIFSPIPLIKMPPLICAIKRGFQTVIFIFKELYKLIQNVGSSPSEDRPVGDDIPELAPLVNAGGRWIIEGIFIPPLINSDLLLQWTMLVHSNWII